ncbi:DUF1987 domain-containing protein [Carboxylicivirga sp. M1479]|uniref:DUF1987 domain-containing protein n=1 Tax=Carboxylicivirga sp. M1479 TaxID=2594476 RepID=UPI001178BB7C|nr:DUF1987 domain-containing protein [Carboxylicivirga sp. M1479]TRX71213.1 DUF1987 domain-containing protein [Carboxylicivirga sp. M1479]
MEVINIAGTDDTPNVILDKDNNKFEISGRSLPEDVNMFYEPILEWIDAYSEAPADKTEFHFKLEYFNTASSKVILDILLKFEEIVENDNEVVIKWHYHEEEEDMLEAGEEYADIVEIPFDYISYTD